MRADLQKFQLLTTLAFAAVLSSCCHNTSLNRTHGVLTIAQVRQLTGKSDSRHAVRFQGELTLENTVFGFVVVQDKTGGLRVQPSAYLDERLIGHTVEVQGELASHITGEVVTNASLKDLGVRPLLKARSLRQNDLRSANWDDTLVSVSGIPRTSQMTSAGHLVFTLDVHGTPVTLDVVKGYASVAPYLVDAEVTATGVANSSIDFDGKVTAFTLIASDLNRVRIDQPPADPRKLPAYSVAQIRNMVAPLPRHRVRVQGTVARAGFAGLLFRDGTGSIPLHPNPDSDLPANTTLEAATFLAEDGATPYFEGPAVLTADPDVLNGRDMKAEMREKRRSHLLRTAAEVRALNAEEARLRIPLFLDGVVTYYEPEREILFFQDKTAGIFVRAHGTDPIRLRAGDRVQLSGVSGPGEYAPIVENPHFNVIGHSPYPVPAGISADEIFLGQADSQWVELKGVIEKDGLEGGISTATVALGPHRFTFRFAHPQPFPPNWQDAEVVIRGACGSLFNSKRQMVGIQLFVPNPDQVQVLKPGGGATSGVLPISQLLQFSHGRANNHRVHIRGEVLAAHPNGPTWIHDASGAVVVHDHNSVILSPGDIIEVAGFAVPGQFSPEVEHSIVSRIGHVPEALPERITAETALSGTRDAQLVQIDAKLLDQFDDGKGRTMLLEAGRQVFSARAEATLPHFEKSVILGVTGICLVAAEPSRGVIVPRSFELYVRTPADVVVLRPAPWLTPQFAFRALSITVAVIAVIFCWVLVLRRRVRRQTEVIAQKLKEVDSLRQVAEAASRAKGEFLAVMSHEIRTPMNGVIGMTSLLLDTSLTSEQADYTRTIRQSGDLLMTVLNDILDFSKIDAGKLELEHIEFELASVIQNCAALVKEKVRQSQISFLCEVTPGVPEVVFGDPTRLQQVLLNLLSNAVKFTLIGNVTLRVSCSVLDSGVVHLDFEVADTGIGMDAATLDRLFSSFSQADTSTTRRFGGTGLGLVISKRLINLMGGDIQVRSAVGEGTCFSFFLPVEVSNTLAAAAVPSGAIVEPTPKSAEHRSDEDVSTISEPPQTLVLLAEDNAVNQKVAQTMLTRLHCTVDIAANGIEAVDLAQKRQYDLILMDCQMPEMDGFQATTLIRLREGGKRRTPIVAATANAFAEDKALCLSVGMDDHIPKPITKASLEQVLHRWVATDKLRDSPLSGESQLVLTPADTQGR